MKLIKPWKLIVLIYIKKNSKDENDVEFKPKLSKTPTKEASSTKKSKNRKKKPDTESEQEEEDE